jgi:hypothetical protein
MAAHRKSDRRRVYLCAGELRKCASLEPWEARFLIASAFPLLDVPQAELNDAGSFWSVETVRQNKNRKTSQLFFGQFRTLGLRKSARFAQTP